MIVDQNQNTTDEHTLEDYIMDAKTQQKSPRKYSRVIPKTVVRDNTQVKEIYDLTSFNGNQTQIDSKSNLIDRVDMVFFAIEGNLMPWSTKARKVRSKYFI